MAPEIRPCGRGSPRRRRDEGRRLLGATDDRCPSAVFQLRGGSLRFQRGDDRQDPCPLRLRLANRLLGGTTERGRGNDSPGSGLLPGGVRPVSAGGLDDRHGAARIRPGPAQLRLDPVFSHDPAELSVSAPRSQRPPNGGCPRAGTSVVGQHARLEELSRSMGERSDGDTCRLALGGAATRARKAAGGTDGSMADRPECRCGWAPDRGNRTGRAWPPTR